MDIYLVNSYRNNRDGTFTDVTEKAGLAAGGYGQGVAVGDYDGDGFPISTSPSMGNAFCITTTATGPLVSYRESRRYRPRMGFECGVVRL
jgi:FG-GAP-like repeat